VIYELIDTPGFDDTERSNEQVLEELAEYLVGQYGEGHLLSGVLYLHPLSYSRVYGSVMSQLRVFEKLCGPDFYENVVLGTTFWEVIDPDVAVQRESQLFSTSNFFGFLNDFGARTTRIYQAPEACFEVLHMFAGKSAIPLQIQSELANGVQFRSTGAAHALSADMSQLWREQEAELRAQLEDFERREREHAEKAKLLEEERTRRYKEQGKEADRRARQEQKELRVREREKEAQRQAEAAAEQQRLRRERERAEQVRQEREKQTKQEAKAAEDLKKARAEELRREQQRQKALQEERDLLEQARVSRVPLVHRSHVSAC
jgi:hypothetical protein